MEYVPIWERDAEDRGIEKGMEKGMEKGIEKNRWEVAKNGLAMGLPLETIVKLTGLPIEKIKLMKSKMELEQSRET
jgi:predicted transposase/invertase (TIGR01784 family)